MKDLRDLEIFIINTYISASGSESPRFRFQSAGENGMDKI